MTTLYEHIGHKIREAQLEKLPYMLVVGDKEQAAGTVSVRERSAGDLGPQPLEQVLQQLEEEASKRLIRNAPSSPSPVAAGGSRFAD